MGTAAAGSFAFTLEGDTPANLDPTHELQGFPVVAVHSDSQAGAAYALRKTTAELTL